MGATGSQPAWEAWAKLAQAASQPGPPIPFEQLLLVRDLAGNHARRSEPAEGVVPREAAVLILLYPDGADLRLPLTVRSTRLASHSGEISLPGGSIEPYERSPIDAALRECHEELGVEPDSLAIWGMLAPLYIQHSNFRLTPVVGFSRHAPLLHPNADEVSAVITVTLRELLDPQMVVSEQWTLREQQVQVPYFAIDGHKVWGATAAVLSEFVARMRRAV